MTHDQTTERGPVQPIVRRRRVLVTYHVNCDCCSYNWTRRPMRGAFLRCRGCGRLVGDMDVSIVSPNTGLSGGTPSDAANCYGGQQA